MKQPISIALIGCFSPLGKIMLNQLRLIGIRPLLIGCNDEELAKLSDYVKEDEVEFNTCPRDACWEADMVIVALHETHWHKIVEMVRDVVIQKPIICLKFDNQNGAESLKLALPYSKLVVADFSLENMEMTEISIMGEVDDVVTDTVEWLEGIGLKKNSFIIH